MAPRPLRVRPERLPAKPRVSAWLAGLLAAVPSVLAPPARAEAPPPTTSTHPPTPTPTRSLWLAPTYQLLLSDAFEPSSRHGVGIAAGYEFHISPRFDIGLTLAYRLYPGSSATQQLGYGVILKHFFSPAWSYADGVYPYLDYGLLLQQSYVEGRRGSAVSHDTRLGAGSVVRVGGIPLFVSVAAHYSRLQYLDIDSTWIGYLEAQVGWVQAF